VYRDSVWQGTDMLGTGVASFGHMSHVHIQNTASWDKYIAQLNSGELPLSRAFLTTDDERLTREMILQLKLGKISTEYFQEKFGSDIQHKFSKSYQKLEQEGMVTLNGREIKLTPKGLLRVDSLLPEFYENKYQNSRYT
jgi:oxygen-independent coproporphyrinogen-3 oxidase